MFLMLWTVIVFRKQEGRFSFDNPTHVEAEPRSAPQNIGQINGLLEG